MKKISRFLRGIFEPKDINDLDLQQILDALNDANIRRIWLYDVLQELKRIHLEVDKRLIEGDGFISDLAVRRKAYQDVLEGVLSAKRQAQDHNPKTKGQFDLESVTVQSAY